ncbi:MAG: hypothetical protein M1840_004488 [Geoglossum simile]|nr:MAG: hypothetical protein M1840_004488 [Geoglossum simile]
MSTDAPIDEFAQTRAPDDLFDDDFTPVTEPTILAQSHHTAVPSGPRPGRGENSQRGGRGRGKGRGRGANEGPSGAKAEGTGEKLERKETTQPLRGDRAPTGDRTATGGVAKVRTASYTTSETPTNLQFQPKLTESELQARLASVRLRNAALEAAHRRAEADEASFQEREERELAKRVEERANRRVLEGEREKNRQRKLKAVEGREWDAEKKEEDYTGGPRGGSAYSRGAHGGVAGGRGGYRGLGREFAGAPPRGRGDPQFAPRGRGEFNTPRGPRGSGRGRGGFTAGGPPAAKQSDAGSVPQQGKATEFPSLPDPKNSIQDKKSTPPPKLTFPITSPPNAKVQKPGSPGLNPKRPGQDLGPQNSNSPKPGNPNKNRESSKQVPQRSQDVTIPNLDGTSDERPSNPKINNKESSSIEPTIGTRGRSSAREDSSKITITSLQSPTVGRSSWAEQMEAGTPTT